MELKKFEDLKIRDIDGDELSLEEFILFCKKEMERGLKVYVGSDSQTFYSKVSMVTAVCVHHPSKGANAFYVKQKVSKDLFPTLKSRMMAELFCSINAGFMLQDRLGVLPEIHIDIGSDPNKCKTFPFKKEFLSIIHGQGFVGKAKPDGWASSVADWFTKT